MMRALYSAATGMIAQQYNIDTISNNIANVNTTGFRKNEARFQDLIYQNLRAPGTPVGPSVVPVGQDVGLGVKIGASEKIFTQGVAEAVEQSARRRDRGRRLLPGDAARRHRGVHARRLVQARCERLDRHRRRLLPQPADHGPRQRDAGADRVRRHRDRADPRPAAPQQLGQINLVRFVNAAGLAPKGQNLLVQTGASGAPTVSQPGLNGTGTLQGGYLEQSNVSVVEEIVNMITAQRAYEANSKSIQTADEMLQTAVR